MLPHDELPRTALSDRAFRDQAAAEYALSVLSQTDESPAGLLAAALSVSAHSAATVGESLTAWHRRTELRYGADIFDRAEWDLDSVEADGLVAQSLLTDYAFDGFAQEQDPLSTDPRTDVPAMQPSTAIGVSAGISGVRLPLQLVQEWPVLAAEVDVMVDLHATQRGAHMSRLQEAVVDAAQTPYSDAVSFGIDLAARAARSQECASATVTARIGQQPRISSAVTRRASTLDVVSTVVVSHDGERVRHLLTMLSVQIMTACPCTIMYSRLASERSAGREYGPEMPPTFTHSQPGVLEIGVSTDGESVIDLSEILSAAQASAVLREAVLKRPDEHELVERAHRRPQFTEDVTRAAAAAVACRVPGDAIVSVRASLAESIHPHRATSSICVLAADLHAQGSS